MRGSPPGPGFAAKSRREIVSRDEASRYPINPGNQVAIGRNQNTAASSSRLMAR
jgi:hypothetical protein